MLLAHIPIPDIPFKKVQFLCGLWFKTPDNLINIVLKCHFSTDHPVKFCEMLINTQISTRWLYFDFPSQSDSNVTNKWFVPTEKLVI